MAVTVELQAPLTQRDNGPGLILVVPSTLALEVPQVGFLLDPLPTRKWAEEGFCVACISLSPDDAGELEAAMKDAVERLSTIPALSELSKLGLIVYDTALLNAAMAILPTFPTIGAIVGYTRSAVEKMDSAGWLSLIHLAGVPLSGPDSTGVYTYEVNSEHFVVPGQPKYDKPAATLAHQRSLVFLRKLFDGPYFDLEKIWEEHTLYEFGERAVEKTMATMVEEPYVNHVPTLTGGIGRSALTDFYANHFIFSNPDSIALKLVSRTIGPDRVVDEMIIEFTHDRVIDWMLPGIPPTGKHVSIPLVGVVNVRGDKLYHEHIYWDQASVLVQIGLLPPQLAFPLDYGGKLAGQTFALPVAGLQQAEKMLDPVGIPSNELIP
ncbi:NTF2-like protein [Calocera cornea HHB12733]|uniref:NTF2-like protein n=1 Tax=Calocera cornea HHB12733 TaxID=1353952 RepID=A0A165GGX7_9BASI|nr:NTF2-like protein [Calocera cornea HHB12733]